MIQCRRGGGGGAPARKPQPKLRPKRPEPVSPKPKSDERSDKKIVE